LKKLRVLQPDGTLGEKKNAITLRMLLTHTAGFGYTFFNERLRDWAFPVGVDEFSGRIEDMNVPLLFQPGDGWEYGVSLTKPHKPHVINNSRSVSIGQELHCSVQLA
jgi:hypothetical protein